MHLSLHDDIFYSYIDVSTVDVATSKLISEQIKTTGAQFLEVNI